MTKNFSFYFFIAMLTGISLLFFRITAPFVFSIFGGLLLAHLFYPVYEKFLARGFSKSISAAFSTLAVILSVVLPIVVVSLLFTVEVRNTYDSNSHILGNSSADFYSLIEQNSLYQTFVQQGWFNFFSSLESEKDVLNKAYEIAEGMISASIEFLTSFVVSVPTFLLNIIILIYLLYYFFIEGERLIRLVQDAIPLKRNETEQVLKETSRIIKATIFGTIFMGLVEGTYGALIFTFFSISSAWIWGVIMAILTIIPLVGANTIIIPAALYMIFFEDVVTGIFIIVLGSGGVLAFEYLIKPRVVGDRSGLHPGLVVISSLGAISVMGIVGFIVGPVIATLFLVAWRQFRLRMSDANMGDETPVKAYTTTKPIKKGTKRTKK